MLSGLISLIERQRDQTAPLIRKTDRVQNSRSPMYETEVVDRFDRKNTFRHVELAYILGERIILDQPISLISFAQLTLRNARPT